MFERFIDTKEFLRLPISGNLYKVNIDGYVIDKNGNILKPVISSSGEIEFELNWFNGLRYYKISEIMAHTFKPIRVPLKYWNLLSVKYLDSDFNNFHPSNLVWKFPIGLGSNEHNGFAFIPMFTRYMINKDGVVFDSQTLKIQTGHYNKGYFSFSLHPDVGPRTCLKRHRGLCLAFTDYPVNIDYLQVNHINGIAGYDKLENLEWVTPSENKIHAVKNGLTTVNKPVLVLNTITNEITEFNTLKELCKHFSFNEEKISKYLANPEEPFFHEKYLIKYKHHEHAVLKNTTNVELLVKNLRTGDVAEYFSISECSKKLNISKDIILYRLKNPNRNIYSDGFLFKRKKDDTPWYEPFNFEQELLLSDWNKKVLIKDLRTGNVKEFNSQRLAARYLKISESTLFQRLAFKNQPVFKIDNTNIYIIIKNKTDSSPWRVVNNPEEEYSNNLVSKKVLVLNVVNNEITEFESAKACAEKFGILTTTLNWRLKSKGQKLYDNGLMFKYKNEITPFATINKTLLGIITSAPDVSNYILQTSLIAGNSQ